MKKKHDRVAVALAGPYANHLNFRVTSPVIHDTYSIHSTTLLSKIGGLLQGKASPYTISTLASVRNICKQMYSIFLPCSTICKCSACCHRRQCPSPNFTKIHKRLQSRILVKKITEINMHPTTFLLWASNKIFLKSQSHISTNLASVTACNIMSLQRGSLRYSFTSVPPKIRPYGQDTPLAVQIIQHFYLLNPEARNNDTWTYDVKLKYAYLCL